MPVRHRRCVLIPVGLALCLGCAAERSGGPNLLLVVVDTLRQDHLTPYGYDAHPTSPGLAALTRDAVLVRGLTGVSSWTKPSIATLFTGLPPAAHRVSRMTDSLREPRTLAAILAEAGYATGAVQANFVLQRRWLEKDSGFDLGFASYDDTLAARAQPHRGSSAQDVALRAVTWLGEREPSEPWFLFLQFFDPHVAYEPHAETAFEDPSYRGWVRGGELGSVLRAHQADTSAADRAQLAAYYDEEIRAVDDALARILRALRERADWDDTVVVFTSDHGEELAERGTIGHTVSLHFEQIDLPLVVRLPRDRNAGAEVRARLPQRDLFPTLLELLEVPGPAGRGESFAGILRGAVPPEDRVCFSEVDFAPANPAYTEKFTRKRSVIADGFKLVHDRIRDDFELFDLDADPEERHDLAGEFAAATRRSELERLMREHAWYEE